MRLGGAPEFLVVIRIVVFPLRPRVLQIGYPGFLVRPRFQKVTDERLGPCFARVTRDRKVTGERRKTA